MIYKRKRNAKSKAILEDRLALKYSQRYFSNELDSIDDQILRLLIDHPSIDKMEICKALEISLHIYKSRIASPAFKHKAARLMEPAVQKFQRGVQTSIDTLLRLQRSQDEKIQLEAAKSLLQCAVTMGLINQLGPEQKEADKVVTVYETNISDDGTILKDILHLTEDEFKKIKGE